MNKYEALKHYFGYEEFRNNQEEILFPPPVASMAIVSIPLSNESIISSWLFLNSS